MQGAKDLKDVKHFLLIGECPQHLDKVQRRRLTLKVTSYQLIGEDLYHKGKDLVLRRVPTKEEIHRIVDSCHGEVCGGHFTQEITSKKITLAGYTWPSLHRDVHHWCKSCQACQLAGDKRLTYEPRNPIISFGPFEKWGIDAAGPLPRTSTRKVFIIVAVDYMTRWAEAVSTRRITAQDVGKFVFENICCRFGTPLEIISDHGPGFRSDVLKELMRRLNVKHRFSSPYYPQCNGLVEKVNGVLVKIISK